MDTNIASVLGIQGKLRIRQHPNTQKAHVILKRVELEEDSDDEEERPAGTVYYSLFAAKRFEVKPGKEILLSIEGAMDGRAILFQGNGRSQGIDNEDADSVLISDTEATTDIPIEDSSDAPLPPKLSHRFYTSAIDHLEEEEDNTPTKCSVGVQASPDLASFAVQATSSTSSSAVQTSNNTRSQASQVAPTLLDASVSTYIATESIGVQVANKEQTQRLTPTSSHSTSSTLLDRQLVSAGTMKNEPVSSPHSSHSPIYSPTTYSPVRGRSLSPMELDTPTGSQMNSPTLALSIPEARSPTDSLQSSEPEELPQIATSDKPPASGQQTMTTTGDSSSTISTAPPLSNPLPSSTKTTSRYVEITAPVASSSKLPSVAEPPRLPRALAGLSPRAREKAPQGLPRLASVSAFENPLTIKPSRAVSISTTRVMSESTQPAAKKRKMDLDTEWFPDQKPSPAIPDPLPPPPSEPPPSIPPSPPPRLSEEKISWTTINLPKRQDKISELDVSSHNPLIINVNKSTATRKSLLDVFVPASTKVLLLEEKEPPKDVPPDPSPTPPPPRVANFSPVSISKAGSVPEQKPEQPPYAPAFVPRRLLPNGNLREKEMAPLPSKPSLTSAISRNLVAAAAASVSPSPSPAPTLVFAPTPSQSPPSVAVNTTKTQKVISHTPQIASIPPKPVPVVHPLPPKPQKDLQSNGTSQKKATNGTLKSHNKRPRSPSPEATPRRTHSWLTLRCYHSATMQGSGTSASIEQISFSADGKSFALKCADRTVRIWNASTRTEIARLAHNSPVLSVTWLELDTGVIVLGADGVVGQWLKQGSNQWQWSTVVVCETDPLAKHGDLQLAYHKDRIAVASLRSGVRLWFWQKGQWRAQGSINRQNVTSIRFVEDGIALVGGTRDGVVWYCQVPNGTLRAYSFLKSSIQHIDVDPLGNNAIISGQTSGCLVRLKAADPVGPRAGDIIRSFVLPTHNQITGSATGTFVAQGQGVLFGCVDGCLLVWDTKKGTLVYGLEHDSEKDGISSVGVNNTPSGCILTGTTAGILRWWSQPATNNASS